MYVYIYIYIYIQYALCIFRHHNADITEDMSFYPGRNKD